MLIKGTDTQATKPAAQDTVGSLGWFKRAVPAVSLATQLTPEWFNRVQGSLHKLIVNGDTDTYTYDELDDQVTKSVKLNYRNQLINGDFSIDQRGLTTVANNQFLADRWRYLRTNAGTHTPAHLTASLPTFAQAKQLITSGISLTNNAIFTLAATDICYIRQGVEGSRFAVVAQQPMVVSFWIKASKVGTLSVSVGNGTDRTFVSTVTVVAANTWEKKTITILPSPSTGTWNYTTGAGLFLNIILAAGTSQVTSTLNTWNSNNLIAANTQTNYCSAVSDSVQLANVQLERGYDAGYFQQMPSALNLDLCSRYFQKIGNTANNTTLAGVFFHTYTPSATAVHLHMPYRVPMRIAPTVDISNIGAQVNVGIPSYFTPTVTDTFLQFQLNSNGAGLSACRGWIELDAEL